MHWNAICTKKNISIWVDKLIYVLSVKPIETWQGSTFLYSALISNEWKTVNVTELAKIIGGKRVAFEFLKQNLYFILSDWGIQSNIKFLQLQIHFLYLIILCEQCLSPKSLKLSYSVYVFNFIS